MADVLVMAVKAEGKAADARVRRGARRHGFGLRKENGRFTLARSLSGDIAVQGLTARDTMRWLREFG
jgi:hypothetical protein